MEEDMNRHPARYAVTSGLSGCYMPDNHSGAMEVYRRRDFAAWIRDEVESAGLPASAARQVKLRNLWRFIARNGSSCAHFTITHDGREVAFHGLTLAEYEATQADD